MIEKGGEIWLSVASSRDPKMSGGYFFLLIGSPISLGFITHTLFHHYFIGI